MANWKRISLMTAAALIFSSLVHTAARAELPKEVSAAIDSKDYKTALKQLRPLADHGNAEAQYWIGQFYLEGDGVKEDDAEAAKWYRKAADLGDADAQDMLGWQYMTGHGVEQDTDVGNRWFLRAANQGNQGAMNHLAEQYMVGADDFTVEYFWWSILAKLNPGNKSWDESRDQAEKGLTPEQKAKLDQRIADWKPTPESSTGKP